MLPRPRIEGETSNVSAGQDRPAPISCRAWLEDLLAQLDVVVSPLASVAENLALDEALLRWAAAECRSTLRLWWGDAPTVVLGNSEKAERVADLAACERLGVQVVRRPTGGGAILQTPDVLNYSLTAPARGLLCVRESFAFGARLLIGALARLGVQAEARGISDVAVGDHKISGNSQSWRRGGLLLHGTLLYDLDVDLVEACLHYPPREPDYRRGRSHRAFLTTLRALGVAAARAEVESAVAASAQELTGK